MWAFSTRLLPHPLYTTHFHRPLQFRQQPLLLPTPPQLPLPLQTKQLRVPESSSSAAAAIKHGRDNREMVNRVPPSEDDDDDEEKEAVHEGSHHWSSQSCIQRRSSCGCCNCVSGWHHCQSPQSVGKRLVNDGLVVFVAYTSYIHWSTYIRNCTVHGAYIHAWLHMYVNEESNLCI